MIRFIMFEHTLYNLRHVVLYKASILMYQCIKLRKHADLEKPIDA
jgi:hypothetical protein